MLDFWRISKSECCLKPIELFVQVRYPGKNVFYV